MKLITQWRWSISRALLLRNCPAAFGFRLKSNHNPRSSSNLTPLRSIPGICIHEAISSEIDYWAYGKSISIDRATKTAIDRLQSIYDCRTSYVVEAYNGYPIEEADFARFRRTVKSRLEHFFNFIWPIFRHYQHFTHELFSTFKLADVEIGVRVDLACWMPDRKLAIIDWKTGTGADISIRQQLTVYSTWAMQYVEGRIDKVTPMLVNLRDGSIKEFHPVQEDLEILSDIVKSDVLRVNEYDEEGRFPALPRTDKCLECIYLRDCIDGRRQIGYLDVQK